QRIPPVRRSAEPHIVPTGPRPVPRFVGPMLAPPTCRTAATGTARASSAVAPSSVTRCKRRAWSLTQGGCGRLVVGATGRATGRPGVRLAPASRSRRLLPARWDEAEQDADGEDGDGEEDERASVVREAGQRDGGADREDHHLQLQEAVRITALAVG